MDNRVRNNLFAENQHLISGCVKRNMPLITALRIETDDVYQDLSLKMCRAIEKYDNRRCLSMPLFLYHELQHEILDLRRRHKPYGMVGVPKDVRPDVIFLNHPLSDGTYFDIPADDENLDSKHDISLLLTTAEHEVITRKVNGEYIRKKTERTLLSSAREKLIEYFHERMPEYA